MNQQVREIISYLDIQIRAIEKELKNSRKKSIGASSGQEDFLKYTNNILKKEALEQVKKWILKEFG